MLLRLFSSFWNWIFFSFLSAPLGLHNPQLPLHYRLVCGPRGCLPSGSRPKQHLTQPWRPLWSPSKPVSLTFLTLASPLSPLPIWNVINIYVYKYQQKKKNTNFFFCKYLQRCIQGFWVHKNQTMAFGCETSVNNSEIDCWKELLHNIW